MAFDRTAVAAKYLNTLVYNPTTKKYVVGKSLAANLSDDELKKALMRADNSGALASGWSIQGGEITRAPIPNGHGVAPTGGNKVTVAPPPATVGSAIGGATGGHNSGWGGIGPGGKLPPTTIGGTNTHGVGPTSGKVTTSPTSTINPTPPTTTLPPPPTFVPATDFKDSQYYTDLGAAQRQLADGLNPFQSELAKLQAQTGGRTLYQSMYDKANRDFMHSVSLSRSQAARSGLVRSGAFDRQAGDMSNDWISQQQNLNDTVGAGRINTLQTGIGQQTAAEKEQERLIALAAHARLNDRNTANNASFYGQTIMPGAVASGR